MLIGELYSCPVLGKCVLSASADWMFLREHQTLFMSDPSFEWVTASGNRCRE